MRRYCKPTNDCRFEICEPERVSCYFYHIDTTAVLDHYSIMMPSWLMSEPIWRSLNLRPIFVHTLRSVPSSCTFHISGKKRKAKKRKRNHDEVYTFHCKIVNVNVNGYIIAALWTQWRNCKWRNPRLTSWWSGDARPPSTLDWRWIKTAGQWQYIRNN